MHQRTNSTIRQGCFSRRWAFVSVFDQIYTAYA